MRVFYDRDADLSRITGRRVAIVGYAEGYRRHHERFTRERAMLWAPMIGRGFAGVSLSSRF